MTEPSQGSEINQALRRSEERFRALSRRLLQLQDEEHRYIARELHDEIGQTLTLARVQLGALQRRPEAASVVGSLKECSGLVTASLDRMGALLLELRPPLLDDLGLAPALRWLKRQVRCSSLDVQLEIEAMPCPPDPAVATACFRLAQEALSNIVRHARARSARIELRCRAGRLQLSVRDDGIGFDPGRAREKAESGACFGLLGVEERVALAEGMFACESAPGQGATLQAIFPCAACKSRNQPVKKDETDSGVIG